MRLSQLFAVLGFVFFSINAFSETDTPPTETEIKKIGSIYLSLGKVSFDAKKASDAKIDDTATYIRFGGEVENDSLIYGGGMSLFQYRDGAGFDQYVQDLSGNTSTASSSASSFNIYGEMGYAFVTSTGFRADLIGGYEHILESSRSIPNCSDCKKDNIDIKSGLYVSPRLRYVSNFGNTGHYTITLSYSKGIGGDVQNATMLTFGFGGI